MIANQSISTDSANVSYPVLSQEASTQKFFAEHNLDASKPYSKGELAQLGYGMYNRVGDGQVAIIKEIGGQDTSDDALITKAHLRNHINETLPEGIESSQLQDIAADMEKFMKEVQILTIASDIVNPNGRIGGTMMHNYAMQFIHKLNRVHPDWNVMTKADEANLIDYDGRIDIIGTAIAEVRNRYQLPDNVRGIPLSRLDRRGEGRGVFGYPCPCMECNYIFPQTDGIKIYDVDGSITGVPGQVRMNVVTNHLASHGINNNNNKLVDSDHRYMTLAAYLNIYAKRGMDNNEPNILDLDYRKIEQEVLTKVLDGVLQKIGLKDQLPEEELTSMVKNILFIK